MKDTPEEASGCSSSHAAEEQFLLLAVVPQVDQSVRLQLLPAQGTLCLCDATHKTDMAMLCYIGSNSCRKGSWCEPWHDGDGDRAWPWCCTTLWCTPNRRGVHRGWRWSVSCPPDRGYSELLWAWSCVCAEDWRRAKQFSIIRSSRKSIFVMIHLPSSGPGSVPEVPI